VPQPPLSSAQAFHRAGTFRAIGKFAEAEAVLGDALTRDPQNGMLHIARGMMLSQMGRPRDALLCFRAALAADPRSSDAWTNLGTTLSQLKYRDSAILCHERAVELAGGSKGTLGNLASALFEAGRLAEAISVYDRALELDSRNDKDRFSRGLCRLTVGDYREGWADYAARLTSGQITPRDVPGAAWDGQAYSGKSLLLLVEQGFGDTLWAARYLPRVKALGGELIVECQREAVPVLAEMRVADRLVPSGEALPPTDLYCHLCSLPGLFTPDLASVPTSPYLTAPAERMAKLAPLFEAAADRLKVGIVWSGSITFAKNQERAQPLTRFLEAFAVPGVQLYSLQKGPPEKELRDLPRGAPITDLAPALRDFADTAAAVAHLDLVIMTDSAVAHLAGAMGKPVWLLLGRNASFLWLEGRSDSPWYPTLRLYRSRVEDDWSHVFDRAALDLMAKTPR
jgi:hypothetical protein